MLKWLIANKSKLNVYKAKDKEFNRIPPQPVKHKQPMKTNLIIKNYKEQKKAYYYLPDRWRKVTKTMSRRKASTKFFCSSERLTKKKKKNNDYLKTK